MAAARKRFFITAWILPTVTKLCRQALRLPLSGSANVDRENDLAIKTGECSLCRANKLLKTSAFRLLASASHHQSDKKEETDMKVHHTMLVASMIAAAPLVAADRPPEKSDGDRSRYSDREMRKTYDDEEKKLEQALKPGQDRNAYRRELEKMGSQIYVSQLRQA
jgi:hypothetical protein